jgi:uncharacterized membrane protein HdeD (DUF308 family)
MLNVLARRWWLVALRGAAALVFGLLTLFNPAVTLAVLVLFFGAYALVNGAFTIAEAVASRGSESNWTAHVVSGVLSVIIGLLTFFMPGVTGLILLYFIAAWAIVTGLTEIIAGIRLRNVITGEWFLVLAGVLSVVFGLMLIVFPGAGALAVALWIGAYATVFGILLIALGLRLRSWGRGHPAEGTLRTA